MIYLPMLTNSQQPHWNATSHAHAKIAEAPNVVSKPGSGRGPAFTSLTVRQALHRWEIPCQREPAFRTGLSEDSTATEWSVNSCLVDYKDGTPLHYEVLLVTYGPRRVAELV